MTDPGLPDLPDVPEDIPPGGDPGIRTRLAR